MKSSDIARMRLARQCISRQQHTTPAQVVQDLGAVQAQDLNGAIWAVAGRTIKGTRAMVEQALAKGSVVRTWPMRRTLHFVAPRDARWMLSLLAGNVITASTNRHAQVGLSHKDIEVSRKAIHKALAGGKHIARSQMYEVLRRAGIDPDGYRGMHVLAHLAFEQEIIFGRPEGKQPTFTLFDSWVPTTKPLERGAAIRELVIRYFTSHGPATVYDLNWWSGLGLTAIRAALHELGATFESAIIDDRTYYWKPLQETDASVAAYLLAPFDEYIVGYRYRGDVLHDLHKGDVITKNGMFSPVLVVDGQVVGTWKKTVRAKGVTVELDLFRPLRRSEKDLVHEAAERYCAYLEAPLVAVQ